MKSLGFWQWEEGADFGLAQGDQLRISPNIQCDVLHILEYCRWVYASMRWYWKICEFKLFINGFCDKLVLWQSVILKGNILQSLIMKPSFLFLQPSDMLPILQQNSETNVSDKSLFHQTSQIQSQKIIHCLHWMRQVSEEKKKGLW